MDGLLDLPADVWLATGALLVFLFAAAVLVAVHRRKPRAPARHGIVRDLPQYGAAAPAVAPVADFSDEDSLAVAIAREAGWWPAEDTPWTDMPVVLGDRVESQVLPWEQEPKRPIYRDLL